MTSHLGFLWQVLGMTCGFIAFTLFMIRYVTSKRAAFLFLAIGVLAQALRTIVFSLANYSRLSSINILPRTFENTHLSGLVYIVLVSVSAYFLFLGLWSFVGRKPKPAYSLVYWSFFLSVVIVIILLMLGKIAVRMDIYNPVPMVFLGGKAVAPLDTVFSRPFALAKAFLIAVCVASSLRRADPPAYKRRIFLVGIVSLCFSQLCELAIRFDNLAVPLELSTMLFLFSFYPGIFCILASVKAVHAQPLVVTVPAPVMSPMELGAQFGLGDQDLRLLSSILEGASNKEIAYGEQVSLSVVKHRIFTLYRKLGVASRFELMAIARKAP